MDSRSALPREIRAWRRLLIIKRNETFSLIFSLRNGIYELELRSVEVQGAHEIGGAPRGRGSTSHPRGQGVGPLVLILSPVFFINSKNILREVSGHAENFYFCTKITPWQFC